MSNEKKNELEKSLKILKYYLIGYLMIKGTCSIGKAVINHYVDNHPMQSIEQTFDAGEHIISVPIPYSGNKVMQYEYHEGYEVVDIEKNFILYVNDEPVKCIGYIDNNEETHFIEFGDPIEKTKTLELKPTTDDE